MSIFACEGRTIKAGGAWIFDNEIDTISGRFKNGEIVEVQDFDGYVMGKGYINQNSKIRVRMMTRKADVEVDDVLLKNRIQAAWDYRKTVMYGGNTDSDMPFVGTTGRPDLNCTRLIFGEARQQNTNDNYRHSGVFEASESCNLKKNKYVRRSIR